MGGKEEAKESGQNQPHAGKAVFRLWLKKTVKRARASVRTSEQKTPIHKKFYIDILEYSQVHMQVVDNYKELKMFGDNECRNGFTRQKQRRR